MCDTLGDNTVSVAQGGTATPVATKQLLPPDRVLKELYIYIYTPDQSIAETTLDVHLYSLCAVCDLKKKRVYFRPLTSLRVYSNRFLVLRNHTGMVVPHAFHSCWKLLAFDQIQLDACCAVVWRRFKATFKLRPVIPIFERNEMTVSTKTTITNFNRNHMANPTFFHAVGTQCLTSVFLPLECFLPVFFPGDSQFYEEDTFLWIEPRYNVWPLFCLNNVNWKL